MKLIIVFLTFFSITLSAQADILSPAGYWSAIDNETGQAYAIVEIKIENGELKGGIVEVFNSEKINPLCTECSGDKKDQPIIGLGFIWGLEEDDGVWDDGHILDPDSGDIYSSKIEVIDDGEKLDVRGYIGFAFAGESEIWLRTTAPKTPSNKQASAQ